MSSSAARRSASEDLECLTEEQRQMLAAQAEVDPNEPLDPELLALLTRGVAYIEGGGACVSAEEFLAEIDDLLSAP
jgi:hypothetical protein